MKTKLIYILVAKALVWSATAQTTDKEWQAKAVQKYVGLGIQGSELNKRFVEAHNQLRKSDPTFFSNPQWPMLLADQLAAPQPIVSQAPTSSLASQAQAGTATPSATFSSAPSVEVTPTRVHPTPVLASGPATPAKSDFPVGFVTTGLGVVGLLLWVSAAKAARRRKNRERLFAEAREYVDLAQQGQSLPAVSTSVILKSGETAFYSAPASLYETRAVRDHQAGHVGFRIAKGVTIGGTRGRSISSQQWSQIDSGTLTITNKRLIFDGASADRSVTIAKILSADSNIDGVEVSAESRQKSMVFSAANPLILATIIRICCQAPDPRDLSNTPLEITFTQ